MLYTLNLYNFVMLINIPLTVDYISLAIDYMNIFGPYFVPLYSTVRGVTVSQTLATEQENSTTEFLKTNLFRYN